MRQVGLYITQFRVTADKAPLQPCPFARHEAAFPLETCIRRGKVCPTYPAENTGGFFLKAIFCTTKPTDNFPKTHAAKRSNAVSTESKY